MSVDPRAWVAAVAIALMLAQADARVEFSDARRGFRFSYPAAFGATSPGTDDGFGDRVLAIRFAVFSSQGVGGEAALTRGAAVVDIQAAGGLYDRLSLDAFPPALRAQIIRALQPLTIGTFCQLIAQEQHLDPRAPALAALTEPQRTAIASTDRIRNIDPRVLRCDVEGSTVTFDKAAAFQPGFPRQHVYGAVRFLDAPYTTFQIVRAGPAPSALVLAQMTALVNSWSRM
jgi:hypothetical protein